MNTMTTNPTNTTTIGSAAWDYEGYWNTIIGASNTAKSTVKYFGLTSVDKVSDWLDREQGEVANYLNLESVPTEWGAFAERAKRELGSALES